MCVNGGVTMEKNYKIIALVAVVMCIFLMTWNVFLLKENSELKDKIIIVEE